MLTVNPLFLVTGGFLMLLFFFGKLDKSVDYEG